MMRNGSLGAIAALVTLAVLGGAGGAAAVWTASASVSASTSSVAVATTLGQTGALATTYRYTGSTSAPATGRLVIANTGGAPLTYGLTRHLAGDGSLAQKTTLRLWTGTCGTTAPSGAVTTTLADAAPPLPAAARTLAPGASVAVCVSTQIDGASNAALQGQTLTATFTATGTVGTNWTTTASAAAVTQSVYRLAAAGAPACVRTPPREAVLTWTAPANRTPGATLTYRVLDTASGATIATLASAATTVSVELVGDALPADGTYSLAIEAREVAESGTTAAASTSIAVTRSANGSQKIRYDCS